MAKVTTISPISSIQGKINKSDDVFYSKRYGRTVITRTLNPYQGPSTEKQQAARERFKAVVQLVNEELSNPTSLAVWKDAFKKQKKYRSLRGMVFAQLFAQMQNPNE